MRIGGGRTDVLLCRPVVLAIAKITRIHFRSVVLGVVVRVVARSVGGVAFGRVRVGEVRRTFRAPIAVRPMAFNSIDQASASIQVKTGRSKDSLGCPTEVISNVATWWLDALVDDS